MKESPTMASAPMLVIAVGNFADTLLANTQQLFHHADPRRLTMVGVYKVISAGGGEEDLRLEGIGEMQAQASSSLEAVLHDLRLHEKFLEAGLGDMRSTPQSGSVDQQDRPLGVIVLTDLTESGSESLYPLIEALGEQMAKEPGGYMYLLCKTAIFEGNPAKKLMQARLHLHLRKLTTLAGEAGLKFQTYLFDGLKEGLLEAKNEHEIGILMQNFLLTLLSGRLAQRLAHTYAFVDEGEGEVLFNSAGATALIYDPVALQAECTRQLAIEILDTEFISKLIPDPAQIETAVNGILESTGHVSAWAADLCAGTPFHAAPAQQIKLDLHFSDLQFEGLPPQEWGDAIAGYAAYFQQKFQPVHFETLQQNATLLGQAGGAALEAELITLPARSNLYPGGMVNTLQVVKKCIQALSQRIQICQPVQNENETLRWLEGEYASAMESLDEAISNLPEPPRWVKRLPGKLYTYTKMLFEFLFLREEHAQLLVLSEKIIQVLEAKFIFEFEQRLRMCIVDSCSKLISALEKTQSELNALQAKFQNVKDHLHEQAPNTLRDSSPFRILLNTSALFDWVYARRDKETSEIRAALLEGGLLEDWRNVSEEYLLEGLVSACWSMYQFLNDINVEALLKETEFSDLSIAVVFSTGLLRLLTQGAVPVLRPDFDLSGENISYSANYFLCADPRESDIPGVLKSSSREWQEVATGDPYMILFCRVRQMIPMNALPPLLQSSQAAFESLNEQEQKDLQEAFQQESA